MNDLIGKEIEILVADAATTGTASRPLWDKGILSKIETIGEIHKFLVLEDETRINIDYVVKIQVVK